VARPQALGERPALSYQRSFLKSFLVLGVLFLVARSARLELYLAAPEKLAHSVGMRVLDAAVLPLPADLLSLGEPLAAALAGRRVRG
jgi:hypothetical protein